MTNLFVNASAMGLFSIAKQIPVILAQIPQLIANVFNPELAKLYAENKQEELIEKFKFTIRFLKFYDDSSVNRFCGFWKRILYVMAWK